MTVDDFADFWRNNFKESPPISYILRGEYREFWFRVHYLPDSKRYPESDSEMEEILLRENTIVDDLIGQGKSYILLLEIFFPLLVRI